ncbi:MAG TPA: GGDEF domain-containing protein [Coleofasciculaceae cyanobacterium]|jgi:diguanylate cyclase (GGDEF)-like protein
MFASPVASSAFAPRLRVSGVCFGQQQPLPPESEEEKALNRLFQAVGSLAQEPTPQTSLLQQMDLIRQQTLTFIRNLKVSLETDSLTGLKNRVFFDRMLAAEFEEARRQSKPFSVIMVDLDRFKLINDQFGHDAGDEALKRFASALRTGVGPQGFACRLGGDEFAVLLPDTQLSDAQAVADRIRNAVSQAHLKISHNGMERTIELASSLGIGTLDGSATPSGSEDSAAQAIMSLGLHAPSQKLTKPKLTGLQRFNPFRRWKLSKLWKECLQKPGRVNIPSQLVKIADHAMYCAKNLGKLLSTRHPILGRQVETGD